MNSILGPTRLAAIALGAIALVGCDAIKNVEEEDFSSLPTPGVVLRGQVTGLSSSPVELTATYTAAADYVGPSPQGTIVRTVTKDGGVSFAAIPRNSQYTVTVTQLPIGKLCQVANGSGTAQADVNVVTVTCAPDPDAPTYTVSGSVVGLAGNANGLQLLLSSPVGEETIDVAAGATSFAFTSELLTDFDYEVTVKTSPTVSAGGPPTTHNCTVRNGSGTVVADDIADVEVACGFPVGGSVTLMAAALGAGLKLQLAPPGAAPEVVDVTAAGEFGFDALLPSHAFAVYGVSIAQQPAGQACIIGNAGSVPMTSIPLAEAAATALQVYCKDLPGGPFSGAALTGTYQLDSGRDFVTFFPDGTFLLGSNSATAPERGVEHGFYFYGNFGPGTLWFFVATDTNGSGRGFSQYPATDFFGTTYVAGAVTTAAAGQITGAFDPTGASVPFTLAEVDSTDGQLHGAWASADNSRFIVFDTTAGTAFHAGVNGAANVQDLCIALGAAQGAGADGSYTANATPGECTSIPGGLAPVNTDTTGFFAMPGAFGGSVDFTITAGPLGAVSLQPYFMGAPAGAPVALVRSESNL